MVYKKVSKVKLGGKSFFPKKAVGNITHGRHSEIIEKLQERINISPMTDVEKLELNSMVSSILARGIAFDLDMYVKRVLTDKLKETDMQVLKYETDLMVTQERLSEAERSMQFHKKVLSDLKSSYLTCEPSDKKDILEQIDLREKQILDFNRHLSTLLDLRNKIRKEIDKKNFQESSIKLKEKEIGGTTINMSDIDFKILEE